MDIPPRLRAFLAALVVGVTGLVVGTALALAVIVLASAVGVSFSPVQSIVLSLVLVQGIAFGSVALSYLRYRGLTLEFVGVRVPTLRDLAAVGLGYLTAVGAALVGAMVVSATGVQAGANQAAEFGIEHPETLLWLIPASVLLIGPGEELLFRGIVQRRIREAFDPVPGVVLASLLFASVHFVALSGGAGARLVSISLLFFPSLVFGTVYELTENVVVSALVHGSYNATLFGLLYAVVRYGPGVSM
ncbi:MAG: lysostaphin resistance A-like protein [Halobacteriaceae archaeon]